MQHLEICLPTTEASFDFSQVLKLCSCTAPQNKIQLLSRFFCSFSKLNCLLIGFLSRKVLQRDSSSSMALFVLGRAHSVDYRKTLLTFQIFFIFFHCCHKMKYSCYQDSSNVKSWFVYLTHFQELHPRRAWVILLLLFLSRFGFVV